MMICCAECPQKNKQSNGFRFYSFSGDYRAIIAHRYVASANLCLKYILLVTSFTLFFSVYFYYYIEFAFSEL